MPALIDLTGQTFGRLTVLALDGRLYGFAAWQCRCDCGAVIRAASNNLKRGNTKSCGCLKKDFCKEHFTTHGLSVLPEYDAWLTMIARCYSPKSQKYKDYGARGIEVCSRWLVSFENFHEDMGLRPDGLSLDRRDNDGHYCKSNCRWATAVEQANNKRGSK